MEQTLDRAVEVLIEQLLLTTEYTTYLKMKEKIEDGKKK